MIRARMNGEALAIDPRRTLGEGGEARVIACGKGTSRFAVKIFHAPTPQKILKVERLIASALPECVVRPTAIVEDEGGVAIGYAMRALAPGFEPIALLSRRAYRESRSMGKRDVTRILVELGEGLRSIHAAGAVVGDLNDQNELFDKTGALAFIDADSFQLEGCPCEVSTESFLAPELYGPDLSAPCASPGPRVFGCSSDWYAFAVMAFRSLTGVHPYGGACASNPSLTKRARAKQSVLEGDVVVPVEAREAISLLTPELARSFHEIFALGDRRPLDLELLRAMERELVRCGCGLEMPASRLPCPRCAPRSSAARVGATGALSVEEVLVTRGPIVSIFASPEAILAISFEAGRPVLHELRGGPVRSTVIDVPPERRGYDVSLSGLGATVMQRGGTEGYFVDLGVRSLTAITSDELTGDLGAGSATVGVSARGVYRLAKGWLLETVGGVERPIATVAEGQTRVCTHGSTELVALCERSLGVRRTRVVRGGVVHDLPAPGVEPEETIVDEELALGDHGLVLLRVTARRGQRFVRQSYFERRGVGGESAFEALAHRVQLAGSRAALESIDGGVLVGSRLLLASDHGLVREDLTTGTTVTFEGTASHVRDGALLALSSRGLAVAVGNRLSLMKTSSR